MKAFRHLYIYIYNKKSTFTPFVSEEKNNFF